MFCLAFAACSWFFLPPGLSSVTERHALLGWDQVIHFFEKAPRLPVEDVLGQKPNAAKNVLFVL